MVSCDLGSNSLKFLQFDCDKKERIKELTKNVKSAEGLAKNNLISKSAITRIVLAINEAKELFDLSEAKAVATAAFREAKNQKEAIDEIYKQTGLKFEVIDSKDEANFVRVAVESYLDNDNYMIMDLGGASTELIFKDFDKSFDIGIVTLSDKYSDIQEGIKNEFKNIKEFAKDIKKADLFIATAGTPTTITAFLQGIDYNSYDYKKINGYILKLDDIYLALDRLLKMDYDQRKRWVGVGREDLIIAGIKMFIEILKIYDFKEVLVIDDGVCEGVAKLECKKLKNS